MNNLSVCKTLSYLCRIVEAGERGYLVSAANSKNQGLKLLFKSHAEQRSRFKAEILAEMSRLGHQIKPKTSIRGILHRGRINIFSALAAGNEEREKIILNEITVGEKAALRTFESVLKKNLPPETRELVAGQYVEVRKVVEQIQFIKGKDGVRLIVQVFNSKKYVENAITELGKAGLQFDSVQLKMIHSFTDSYTAKAPTVFETCVSGMVGGALMGSLIGMLAGIGAVQTTAINAVPIWNVGIVVALCGIAAGAFIGASLGFVIGTGISGEDNYIYDKSIQEGQILLLTHVKVIHVSRVGQIMENIVATAVTEEITV
ncbi:MAG: PA2169 family four-helix-bundle protein [Chloroflexi bacterium]|nr:PA2169 family four-helix-bundle protein [Chloroflexota bacterium]